MLLHRALTCSNDCAASGVSFAFQRTSDILRNLTLNAEDVLQFAIVCFRPKIGIVLRIDELHDDANAVAGCTLPSTPWPHPIPLQLGADFRGGFCISPSRCAKSP
jgi:hypothetical protein